MAPRESPQSQRISWLGPPLSTGWHRGGLLGALWALRGAPLGETRDPDSGPPGPSTQVTHGQVWESVASSRSLFVCSGPSVDVPANIRDEQCLVLKKHAVAREPFEVDLQEPVGSQAGVTR